jgi:hypothetical protein
LIWSAEYYLVMTPDREGLRYVFFSISLLLRLALAQISCSALYYKTAARCVPLCMWVAKFRTHVKQQAKLQFFTL